MQHSISVEQRRITSIDPRRFVKNGINADKIDIDADEEWEEYDKVIVVIENDALEYPVSVEWTGRPVIVPPYILTAIGNLSFSLTGYEGDNVMALTELMTSGFGQVVESGTIAGDIPDPDPGYDDEDIQKLNERVDAVETDISEVKDDLSTITQNVSDLDAKVTNLEGSVATIGESLETATGDISNLKEDMTTLEGLPAQVAEAQSDAAEALSKAEEALGKIDEGGGVRGTQISLGEGAPVLQAVRGDSYVDKTTGDLWEYVEV